MYKNKEDQAASSRKHYLNNIEIVKKRAADFKKISNNRNREFVDNYLKNHPCTDCGEKDTVVLEFDHVIGIKINNIANGKNSGWSIKKLEEEINKCEVRCANCHRRITHKRRNNIAN